MAWFPDGRRVLFAGQEAGRSVRLYAQDVRGGRPEPISPEGVRITYASRPISPDGRLVVAVDSNRRLLLQPLGAGPRPISGLEPGDIPIRWSGDGESLFVFRKGEIPGRVRRYHLPRDLETTVAELAPLDRAGVRTLTTVQTTPDGRAYVYTYSQSLADLFLMGGLR